MSLYVLVLSQYISLFTNNISLPLSPECCEYPSLIDKGATCMVLLKEKDRTLISEKFQIRSSLPSDRHEAWKHCFEYSKNLSAHLDANWWRARERWDRTSHNSTMAAKMLGLDFVMGTEYVQLSVSQFLAPLRSPQKRLVFRVVILCMFEILLLKEFITNLKPDVWQVFVTVQCHGRMDCVQRVICKSAIRNLEENLLLVLFEKGVIFSTYFTKCIKSNNVPERDDVI